jgi:WD40 repeat protein
MSNQNSKTSPSPAVILLLVVCFVGIVWYMLAQSLKTCQSLDILLKRSNCQQIVFDYYGGAAFSDDQTILVSMGLEFSFAVRNLKDDTARTIDLSEINPTIIWAPSSEYSFILSPDGRYIVTYGNNIDYGSYILLVDTEPTHLSVKKLFFSNTHSPYKNLSFSKDGKTLAGVVQDSVIFWDIPEGDEIGSFKVNGCRDYMAFGCQIKYSPDGIHVAIIYPGKTNLEIWNIKDKTNARLEYKYTDSERFVFQSINYSPDGNIAAVVSEGPDSKITTTFFDVETWETITRFSSVEPLSTFSTVSFSPDGDLYAIIHREHIEIRSIAHHSIVMNLLPLWDNAPFAYGDSMAFAQIALDNESVYYGWYNGGLVKWKLP